MERNDGGPAFPAWNTITDGMSLRDYFAAKVMQSLVSEEAAIAAVGAKAALDGTSSDHVVATKAYVQADAMLAARAPVTTNEVH